MGRSPRDRALENYKQEAMKKQGFQAPPGQDVKFNVAQSIGIPMNKKYNGNMTAEQAGKIGGRIGGPMVKEMIESAKRQMERQ